MYCLHTTQMISYYVYQKNFQLNTQLGCQNLKSNKVKSYHICTQRLSDHLFCKQPSWMLGVYTIDCINFFGPTLFIRWVTCRIKVGLEFFTGNAMHQKLGMTTTTIIRGQPSCCRLGLPRETMPHRFPLTNNARLTTA